MVSLLDIIGAVRARWRLKLALRGAMCVVTPTGFGTSSSTTLALPSAEHPEIKPVFRFCPGRPDETPWLDVDLE